MRVCVLNNTADYEFEVLEIDNIYLDGDYGLVMSFCDADKEDVCLPCVKSFSQVEEVLFKLLVHGWADLTMFGVCDFCSSIDIGGELID